jgi:acyl-CoA synthetase (AMP-forming)/AMP-acid ligase II
MYLTQGLHRGLRSHADRVAMVFGEHQLTYRQYADRVARLACVLQTLGMATADRVGMLALNSDRYLEFFYGTWWGGGAVNPINAVGALMHAHVMAGGTCEIAPMFTPLATLQAVQQHRITHMLLVPTMIQLVTDHAGAGQYDLSSVQVLTYGGSAISEAVLQRAMKRFPNADFHQAYGMTELSPCATYLNPHDHRGEGRKPDLLRSAGRPSLATEVCAVDDQGIEVPRGTVGEVVVRGATVMLGYWNKPDQTATALRDGM